MIHMKIKNPVKKIIFTCLYLALLFVLYKLGASCIFLRFLHFPCPGCGMTRALLSVFKFDFVSAFHYHAMFWSMPLLYLYFLFDGNLFRNKKVNKTVFILIVVGFGINWVYNLLKFY